MLATTIFATILLFILVCACVDNIFVRQMGAERIRDLSVKLMESPKDPILLKRYAGWLRSYNSFLRCYAISTLGDMGDFKELLKIVEPMLLSRNPFVRDVSAHCFVKVGFRGEFAKETLDMVASLYPNQSCGWYAAKALRKLRRVKNVYRREQHGS